MSRENILQAVKQSLPEPSVLPEDLKFAAISQDELTAQYIRTLTVVGGKAVVINSLDEIDAYIAENYKASDRIICNVPNLKSTSEFTYGIDPHEYSNIELSVIKGHFGVAENASIWVTEDLMGHRVIPFICQHLAIVIDAAEIVADMHDAYVKMENMSQEYGFGTFIAGPSKTADIEQSLVLGAHGPRSLVVFVLNSLN